jgi:hypothetical protein
MSLKQDLLRIGYFPENLPPPFHSEQISQFFTDNPSGYLSDQKRPLRAAIYVFTLDQVRDDFFEIVVIAIHRGHSVAALLLGPACQRFSSAYRQGPESRSR